MIFVTILAVAQIITSVLKMYNPSYEQPGIDFASGFKENSISFIYLLEKCIAPTDKFNIVNVYWLLTN